jgi:hypothetical protein
LAREGLIESDWALAALDLQARIERGKGNAGVCGLAGLAAREPLLGLLDQGSFCGAGCVGLCVRC